ncbi:MAG: DUF4302 domain-containing protein [Bacteroidota bacterium]
MVACTTDNDPKLPSVEERINQATEDLIDKLTDPVNGWRLNYRPTSQTGSFLILMDFNEDGTVRVQSDVSANDGEFRDQIISYRIDVGQGIELIFETYGVFHYLFELQQATFGAEFEFFYIEEDGNNLIFTSKTDNSSDITTLIFQPAQSTDESLISTEATEILSQGIFRQQDLAGTGILGNFNFYLSDINYTLSTTFDMNRRRIRLLGLAEGADMTEIFSLNNVIEIGVETGFSFENETVVLDESQRVSFGGNLITISELPIENFSKIQDSFCTGQQDSIVTFNSNVAGLGNFAARSDLFQVENGFNVDPDGTFSINHIFLYDEMDNSISDEIEEVFPGTVAFQWYHGTSIADSTFFGLGFVVLDEFNNAEFYLRGFDFTQSGGFLQLTFNGEDIITDEEVTQEQLDGLYQLTDQIFSGGDVYVMELIGIDGLFEFYNPCNKYKGFLF